MFIVLIETSGNQNYIFSTNKLKENVGASELTYRVGTEWLLKVVSEINQTPWLQKWNNSSELRKILTSHEYNPPLESSGKEVEIIIATSGKALLLTENEDTAKEIIKKLTTKALKEAPGIDLCGVYVKFDWGEKNWKSPQSLVQAIKRVYRQFEAVHNRKSSPNLRFLRLPIIDECANSGFPASYLDIEDNSTDKQLSQVSYQKQQQIALALNRINSIMKNDPKNRRIVSNVNLLEKKFQDLEWLAVVHADGNGLGQIFLGFENFLEDKSDYREYIDKLRRFSFALDICTEQAFLAAIDVFETKENENLPVVPIVLGGDDLTIICDGKFSLDFTEKFLQAFEAETEKLEHQGGIIPEIAKKAFGMPRLSACAGIGIIKPHFPFSVAYQLAEDLIKQAKTVKVKITTQKDNKTQSLPCSALDFHILYDSSSVDLSSIRKKLTLDEHTKLYMRPYVTTDAKKLEQSLGLEWAKFHHWEKFKTRVSVIVSQDENNQNNIPTNQINNLRAALFASKTEANSQYQLIKDRYPKLKDLAGSSSSLFAQEPPENEVEITGLIDALEAVGFVKVN